ncbi:MAG TPA: winged helix DNA-binding domain-containing protein, partial [Pyrinomonadaceae bacterium]
WAIAQRMQNATDESIERAFNEGKIIRTHVMRPTWHFVAPQDVRWLLELTAPRVNIASGSAYRKFELDGQVFRQTTKVLLRALKGGKHLTRSSLRRILNEAGVSADDGIRLGYILLRAELDRVICSGPRDGNQFTYALFDERVPHTKRIERDQALAMLTEAYFRSHGPASLQDFMWWSGLTAVEAKSGINMVQDYLTRISFGDKVFWAPKCEENMNIKATSACLLADFDEYVVAYKDRSALCATTDQLTITNGILGRTVIVDGKIVGTWKQTNDQGQVTIAVQPYRSLKKSALLAIGTAVNRYAKFLGTTNPLLSFIR